MEVDGAGVAAAVFAEFVGETAFRLWGRCVAPLDGTLLEAEFVAAGFRLNCALALDFVEQLYGAEEFHGYILLCRNSRHWPSRG